MTVLLNRTGSHGTWTPFGQKGDDAYVATVPPGEVFDSCVLTITGRRLNSGASISRQPTAGQTGAVEVDVHWWYDGAGEIDYEIEAFSRKPNVAPSTGASVRVPGFLPSTRGFQFSNSGFPHRPDLILNTPFGTIPIGDASLGLCGGMAYAARDYFEAGTPVPPGNTHPEAGPLFDFIVHRLIDSFDVPDGILKYLQLMDPALPDHETDFSKLNLAPHGRSWRMIVEEWPLIKADLDSGHLSPIALVLVKTRDFSQLGKNHQVLAYGYDLRGSDLTLRIYDPNQQLNDTVTLTINLSQPDHSANVAFSGTSIVSFFRTKYGFETPPGCRTGMNVRAAFISIANNKVVCAENGGVDPLIANRTQAGPWETFDIEVLGSNRIALRSKANNKYVCAGNGGALPLVSNRDKVGPWETFEILHTPDNHVALKSVANHKYVCAENGGSKPLIANRDQVGPWETFAFRQL